MSASEISESPPQFDVRSAIRFQKSVKSSVVAAKHFRSHRNSPVIRRAVLNHRPHKKSAALEGKHAAHGCLESFVQPLVGKTEREPVIDAIVLLCGDRKHSCNGLSGGWQAVRR